MTPDKIELTTPDKVQLTMDVALVLWREGDDWRGEAIDVAAASRGPSFDEAYGNLVSKCYEVCFAAVTEGRLPDRPRSEVDPDVLSRWKRLKKNGARRSIADLRRSPEPNSEITFSLKVKLNRPVPNLREAPSIEPMSIVLVPRGTVWLAQCLEHDVCATGFSEQEAAEAVLDSLILRVSVDRMLGRKPFDGLPPAPPEFWRLYDTGKPAPVEASDDCFRGEFRVAA
jgi:hypothetical protein